MSSKMSGDAGGCQVLDTEVTVALDRTHGLRFASERIMQQRFMCSFKQLQML